MKNLILLLLMIVAGCGKIPQFRLKSSLEPQNVSAIYGSARLNLKIFYEPGAEPYTDQVANFKTFDLLHKNMDALFEGKTNRPMVSVPRELSEMTKIVAQSKTTWSLEEVMALSEANPVTGVVDSTNFSIYFLNGRSKENSSAIGFHISKTNVIAIFKDVIKSTSNAVQPLVPKYVEQATLVHEMGHALGLVDNGVPMYTPHKDTTHGAHCSNPDCVMYYSNEGTASMMSFATQSLAKLSVVMFDQQCLNDTQNYKK
jgi:hypothetical protein